MAGRLVMKWTAYVFLHAYITCFRYMPHSSLQHHIIVLTQLYCHPNQLPQQGRRVLLPPVPAPLQGQRFSPCLHRLPGPKPWRLPAAAVWQQRRVLCAECSKGGAGDAAERCWCCAEAGGHCWAAGGWTAACRCIAKTSRWAVLCTWCVYRGRCHVVKNLPLTVFATKSGTAACTSSVLPTPNTAERISQHKQQSTLFTPKTKT